MKKLLNLQLNELVQVKTKNGLFEGFVKLLSNNFIIIVLIKPAISERLNYKWDKGEPKTIQFNKILKCKKLIS